MITPVPVAGTARTRKPIERRSSPRVTRNIRVLVIAEDSALEEPFGGWIVDTSRGGVRVRVPREGFAIGTLLMIRAPFASERVPWTSLRVKHCRKGEKAWEMGCEFVRERSFDTTEEIKSINTRLDQRN